MQPYRSFTKDQVWIVRAKGTDAPSVLHEVCFPHDAFTLTDIFLEKVRYVSKKYFARLAFSSHLHPVRRMNVTSWHPDRTSFGAPVQTAIPVAPGAVEESRSHPFQPCDGVSGFHSRQSRERFRARTVGSGPCSSNRRSAPRAPPSPLGHSAQGVLPLPAGSPARLVLMLPGSTSETRDVGGLKLHAENARCTLQVHTYWPSIFRKTPDRERVPLEN